MLDVFCITCALMVGTAGLPHIIVRFYTVPTVRAARWSAGWALVFIALLYTTAPALAVFARYNLITSLNGKTFEEARSQEWVKSWEATGLLKFDDKNGDGILEISPAKDKNEIIIDRDIIVLSTPEVAGLAPWVVALVAVGGLAAALSTAAGLLLVISTSLAHDIYGKFIKPEASESQRLLVGRIMIFVAVVVAGYFGINPPGFVAEVVAFAFGLAAASFFPVILLGIFDKRTNRTGAVLGMIVGIGFTGFYIIGNRFFGMPTVVLRHRRPGDRHHRHGHQPGHHLRGVAPDGAAAAGDPGPGGVGARPAGRGRGIRALGSLRGPGPAPTAPDPGSSTPEPRPGRTIGASGTVRRSRTGLEQRSNWGLRMTVYPPKPEISARAYIGSFAEYQRLYRLSIDDPEGFWRKQADILTWFYPPSSILDVDVKEVDFSWYGGGRLNACFNCVDRHLATQPDKVAIIWAGDEAGEYRTITYAELKHNVARVANVLHAQGSAARRPGLHLPADDPGAGLHHAGLRPHRRRPLGGLRRFLGGIASRSHPRRRSEDGDHRQRGVARRQADPAQGHRRPVHRGSLRRRVGPGGAANRRRGADEGGARLLA